MLFQGKVKQYGGDIVLSALFYFFPFLAFVGSEPGYWIQRNAKSTLPSPQLRIQM